jgi:hypothetical protein
MPLKAGNNFGRQRRIEVVWNLHLALQQSELLLCHRRRYRAQFGERFAGLGNITSVPAATSSTILQRWVFAS